MHQDDVDAPEPIEPDDGERTGAYGAPGTRRRATLPYQIGGDDDAGPAPRPTEKIWKLAPPDDER